MNLETNHISSRLVRRLFYLYVLLVIRPLGNFISESKDGCLFLINKYFMFYYDEKLTFRFRLKTFVKVNLYPLFS